MTTPSANCETIFIARQPVFYADEKVWGYELLFRTGEENRAIIEDESQATASVIADGLSMASAGMPEESNILINFPEQLLLDDVGFALPKEHCVIEVLEHVRPTKKTLAAVRRLKEAGYIIAVDDFFGQKQLRPFIELADIVKVDILELGGDIRRIAAVVSHFKDGKTILLAEKVEDNATFNMLKDMGFSLFQGFFFSKPEIIPGRKLSSNEVTKLQLLSELSSQDFEPARLAEILQSDPNLSYRLFRYINSAGFGLRTKVTSLKRAIDMMGMVQAKQWLRTAVIADINSSPRAGELAYLAVHRAKFLESICSHSGEKNCQPDTMFITGLFSLLDAMLGMSMEDVLVDLPLDESIVQGLTTQGMSQGLLDIARSYERSDWTDVSVRLANMGVSPLQSDVIYAQSRNWAQKMVGFSSKTNE